MDSNNWLPPTQPQPQAEASSVDTGDWRAQLPNDSRQRIVNKIMDTLKKHLPFSGQEGLNELKKIAVRFEEKIYSAAANQPDYLRKISLKMLSLETKSQNTSSTSGLSNPSANNNYPPDPVSSIQSQLHGQVQSLPASMANNQSQARQTLSQNVQNNIISSGMQTGVLTTLPPNSSSHAQLPHYAGQNATMPNIVGIPQNAAGSAGGQGVVSNAFASSQRPIQVRQLGQQTDPQQQIYQQQLQQQILKKKMQQGNVSSSLLQSNLQQQQMQQQQMQQQQMQQQQMQQQQLQQQQNMLHQGHLQSSQQSFTQTSLQPSSMQSAPFSGSLQQNQQQPLHQIAQSVLQPQQQTVRHQQQTSIVHQQQTSAAPQSMQQRPQQLIVQQQVMDHQPNSANMQHQLLGQQGGVHDMQQQQQQRLLGQQHNLSNMQQSLMSQQNQLSNIQQQQLVVPSGPNMQSSQHGHMMNHSKLPAHQLNRQSVPALLPTQAQQMQPQQMMPHIPPHSSQLQQLGMQQQPIMLQREAQQRHAHSGVLLQQQNLVDQQRQLFQSQKVSPDTLTSSLECTAESGQVSGGDWQEETYQKIQTMKEMYLVELSDTYQKVAAKVEMQDSLPQHERSQQTDKLRIYKNMLDQLISFLKLQKISITANHKDKLPAYEKHIINFLNMNKPRRLFNQLQQGQIPSHLNPALAQHSQSQVTQVHQNEDQVNPQMQSASFQGSLTSMQQNISALQQLAPTLPTITNGQFNMMNTLQPNSNMDTGQRNSDSLQHIALGSLQQRSAGTGLQGNLSALSTQNGVNMLPPNTALQANSNVYPQNQKQQQEFLQAQATQQMKQQLQQRQVQQFIHKQQMLQQQQQLQQNRQQMSAQLQSAQLQSHQIQLNHMTDSGDFRPRQGFGMKAGVVAQGSVPIQRPVYQNQQSKSGALHPITSTQLLQSVPSQIPQHSSPQIELSTLTKSTLSSQPSNSPLVAPSPSTPLAPSPMPGESEKITSSVSSAPNNGNIGQHASGVTLIPPHSLSIGTPGISASPLLAELATQQGNQASTSVVPGNRNVSELPFDRLMKAIKKLSPSALGQSVGDIASVVSMIDRIAGSAPGNGSRATVGEDLVAMTKCRLQARSILTEHGSAAVKKMKRHTMAMALNDVLPDSSINDNFLHLKFLETSESESTATSRAKRPKAEGDHALLEEIRDINRRLIDTCMEISDEDTLHTGDDGTENEGTVVKCSYMAIALSPSLKSHYAESLQFSIKPLRLLVPNNYPTSSPILLDDLPAEPKGTEGFSTNAKSRFNASLRGLTQPMSLWEVARAWDTCTRDVIIDYAERNGGGCFTSIYGAWEDCVGTA